MRIISSFVLFTIIFFNLALANQCLQTKPYYLIEESKAYFFDGVKKRFFPMGTYSSRY